MNELDKLTKKFHVCRRRLGVYISGEIIVTMSVYEANNGSNANASIFFTYISDSKKEFSFFLLEGYPVQFYNENTPRWAKTKPPKK